MSTNFLYAQAPNRKGNISKHTATGVGGATVVTPARAHGVATPKGNQGAPSCSSATANKDAGVTAGRKQKVMVNTHADYCGTCLNDGYMKNNSYNK
jgi:thiol:disulfide interchange protein